MDEAQGHKAMNKLWRCCCGLASSKTLARAKKSKVGVRTLNSHSKGRNSRRRLPAQRLRAIPRRQAIHHGRCGRRRSGSK